VSLGQVGIFKQLGGYRTLGVLCLILSPLIFHGRTPPDVRFRA